MGRFAVDGELAGAGREQVADESHEGGFAAAGGTDEGDEFAGGDLEVDVLQGDDFFVRAGVEDFVEVLGRDGDLGAWFRHGSS